MFNKKSSRQVWDKFLVLGVFVAFVGAGFLYVGYAIWRSQYAAAPLITKASAPSEAEYRSALQSAVRDFFKQAAAVNPETIGLAKDDFIKLIDATKKRLLPPMRVPAGAQDLHLRIILLLDKWKLAMNGSSADAAAVVAQTSVLLSENPWLIE